MLRTGLDSPNYNPDLAFAHGLTAAAMRVFSLAAYRDAQILEYHQLAARCSVADDPEGAPEELTEEEILEITRMSMKYHILSDQGVARRLNPLIEYIRDGTPVPPQVFQNDPELGEIVNTYQQFMGKSLQAVVQEISTGTDSVIMTDEEIVSSSYQGADSITVEIFEDGGVSCSCGFCEKFLQVWNADLDEFTNLNPVQEIMLSRMHLL